MGRWVLQLIVAVMASGMTLVAVGAPARADNATSFLTLVNSLRAAHHEAALVTDPTLTADAQAWSVHMASGYGLSDNPNLAAEVAPGWTGLAENTGEGGNIPAIFNALVGSPIHLANMLLSAYNLTGVAVAVGQQNTLWLTETFEALPGATPATTAPPAIKTTTSPPTTTVPKAAPPRATTANTAASTTTSTTSPDSTTVAGGDAIASPDPAAVPTTAVPNKLAAADAAAGRGGSGGPLWVLVLALSLFGLAAVASGAYLGARRTGGRPRTPGSRRP